MSSTVAIEIPTGTWSIDPVHSLDRFRREAFRCLDLPRQLLRRRRHARRPTTAHSARSRARCAIENLVTEEPQLTGAPAQRGLLRRRQPPRRSRSTSTSDRAGRGRQAAHQRRSRRSAASRSPVELDAEIEGTGDDPYGNTRLGISASRRHRPHRTGASPGTRRRSPTARSSVGESVAVTLHVEAVRQA